MDGPWTSTSWISQAARTLRWRWLSIITPTSSSTRPGSSGYATTSRPPSSSGAATTPSSPKPGPAPTCVTCPAPNSTPSTPGTSLSRRTSPRSPRSSRSSSTRSRRELARRDDLLQQAAGPFPVRTAGELGGDEVGHPGPRERQDLGGDRVLIPDDRDVGGAGRALPVQHRAVGRQLPVD